ncbi:hypothetical protein KGF56_000157 [Candida oxycetoniae]|uniref:Cyclic nucleotide-binding domain-containing protein n=1 Tax=Candida oxycetoniae TaxID=497107 RepID=A0AAI9T1S0_9ASCO|nr:uncharacterized protein KGF56_000157 [Candida oxycetoniae]KAI3407069.2 hypothetical protein KGF56_000157 [Candida oxycetoniae]
MSKDKIDLYTQPEGQELPRRTVEESAREKIEMLIEKHPIVPPELDDTANDSKIAKKKVLKDVERSQYITYFNNQIDRGAGNEQSEEKVGEDEIEEYVGNEQNEFESDTNLDEDGLEIPQGKIPLDSQFSTAELEKIVDVCKDQGILKENVDLKIVEQGELGDKIRITDIGS